MDKEYLAQYSDANIQRLLLDGRNIRLLETILREESAKFCELRAQKQKLFENDTPVMKPATDYFENRCNEILACVDLVEKIAREVDSTLAVDNIPEPTIQFEFDANDLHNFRCNSHTLILNPLAPNRMFTPYTAHEYTHHIQYHKGTEPEKNKFFAEGHARGVQRAIAQKHAAEENNSAFLYETTRCGLAEFKRTYEKICKVAGVKRKRKLLNVQTRLEHSGAWYNILRFFTQPTHHHARGHTFFYLHEKTFGQNIYGDILHGNYDLRAKTEEMWRATK